jgi:hypothetical protein
MCPLPSGWRSRGNQTSGGPELPARFSAPVLTLSTSLKEHALIILGIILMIAGFFLNMSILWMIGIVLVVAGVVLAVAGSRGRAVGGRRHYY